MNELLKLGTVVRIQDVSDDLMIIGYFPLEQETKRVYTYLGINAAFGISLGETSVIFDHDSITEVIFEGYSDDETDSFREKFTKIENIK